MSRSQQGSFTVPEIQREDYTKPSLKSPKEGDNTTIFCLKDRDITKTAHPQKWLRTRIPSKKEGYSATKRGPQKAIPVNCRGQSHSTPTPAIHQDR